MSTYDPSSRDLTAAFRSLTNDKDLQVPSSSKKYKPLLCSSSPSTCQYAPQTMFSYQAQAISESILSTYKLLLSQAYDESLASQFSNPSYSSISNFSSSPLTSLSPQITSYLTTTNVSISSLRQTASTPFEVGVVETLVSAAKTVGLTMEKIQAARQREAIQILSGEGNAVKLSRQFKGATGVDAKWVKLGAPKWRERKEFEEFENAFRRPCKDLLGVDIGLNGRRRGSGVETETSPKYVYGKVDSKKEGGAVNASSGQLSFSDISLVDKGKKGADTKAAKQHLLEGRPSQKLNHPASSSTFGFAESKEEYQDDDEDSRSRFLHSSSLSRVSLRQRHSTAVSEASVVERQMSEVSHLLESFASLVSDQAETIEDIRNNAREAKGEVEKGGEEAKYWIPGIILLLGMLLLLLNWIMP